MNTMTTPALFTKEQCFKILDNLTVGIDVDENTYNLPLDAVFAMAARHNPKRSYLFVSKLIGKHIPVHPDTPFLAGFLLASRLARALGLPVAEDQINCAAVALTKQSQCHGSGRGCGYHDPQDRPDGQQTLTATPGHHRHYHLPGRVLFVGFAETATALGHGVFSCFGGEHHYLHSTREDLAGLDDTLYFTEDHCHAPEQRCLINDVGLLQGLDMLVLIDDEITSGNTCLNIIRTIHTQYPQPQYVILTILDWRDNQALEKYRRMEQELGTTIHILPLIRGSFWCQGVSQVPYNPPTATNSICDAAGAVRMLHLPQRETVQAELAGNTRASADYLSDTGRFGIGTQQNSQLHPKARRMGQKLALQRRGSSTLCLGTGEFMYLPFLIARHMGSGVRVQSTTRSPVHPHRREDYGVKYAITFTDPFRPDVLNFIYNIPPRVYEEVFVFWEHRVQPEQVAPLVQGLRRAGIKHITFVSFCDHGNTVDLNRDCDPTLARAIPGPGHYPLVPAPRPLGSYHHDDVVFLLKDVGSSMAEQNNETREAAIQRGRHYSEMLPIEYHPTREYIDLFHQSLRQTSHRLALAAAIVARHIISRRGERVVLVSLARAGTPAGVLIKRYLNQFYSLDLPHYSISIIRDRGIDQNALMYILQNHPGGAVQFIDGWTGKGAITGELIKAIDNFNQEFDLEPGLLNKEIAVLADPGHCAHIFGTRDDFLIPSACLNATVSGLMSRTVLRDDLIGPLDFHGAKFYRELAEADLSNYFVDTVAACFTDAHSRAQSILQQNPGLGLDTAPNWLGRQDTMRIQAQFGIKNINLVKPGVGETTRVLLRRVPWKVVVKDKNHPDVQHILMLARDRGVPVEEHPHLNYSCYGLIKTVERGTKR